MSNTLVISDSRGMGFNFYIPSTPYTSEEEILDDINAIPLYNYAIINNPNSTEHGKMYQKRYDSNGNITMAFVFQVIGSIPNKVSPSNLVLTEINQDEPGFADGTEYTLQSFLDALLELLKTI